jgi:ribose transport system ATP-binding protein
MTIRDNCAAPGLSRFSNRLGLVSDEAITDFAEAGPARFNIVTPNVGQRVVNLSGGNRQKVLLAMWVGVELASCAV